MNDKSRACITESVNCIKRDLSRGQTVLVILPDNEAIRNTFCSYFNELTKVSNLIEWDYFKSKKQGNFLIEDWINLVEEHNAKVNFSKESFIATIKTNNKGTIVFYNENKMPKGLPKDVLKTLSDISMVLKEKIALKHNLSDNNLWRGLNVKQLDYNHKTNPKERKVFVVHGRDEQLRDDFFSFLDAVNLHPMEWSEASKLTDDPNPYIGEILTKAFENVQAIIVLLSPDDDIRLSPDLWQENEKNEEKEFQHQARPNVLFEAGLALAWNPRRTLLVQVGDVKTFSDIGGKYIIRFSGDAGTRIELVGKLAKMGCVVSTEGRDRWLRTGNFSISRKNQIKLCEHSTCPVKESTLD